ncbi:synaptopodin-2-like isoform X1 [Haliotis cracherodii]|uniref:synaptopodin-2-like isoform X1 n=1 Tax=Haliotis cracherodii TaxID=6455 RepID=UPI0039EBD03E
MGTGDTVTLTLKGGAPWGFRLQGGGPHPLQVSKIRKRSQAHAQGMQEGDTVVSINGIPLKGRSHDEAMRYVDLSGDVLAIEVFRGNMPSVHTVAGSYAPVINGHSSIKQDGDRVTSTTSASYDDGVKKGSMQTQSFVEKGNGRETRGFVHSEHMSSVVHDEWAPTQAPLPSLLDTSLSKQPYSSQPVQVQVSAMFSGPKDDTKIGNASPKGYSSQQPTANVPMFNVRKVTSSSTTTNTSMSTRQESWQPGDSFGGQEQVQIGKPEDKKYPTFPLPEVNQAWKPTKAAPPPPPPKPVVRELGITRVRDIKTEMLSPRSYDDVEDEGSIISSRDGSISSSKHPHRLPVFAPPVQISLHAGEREDLSGRPHDLDLVRTMSIESEISSPSSSLGNKKLFGDSAFYDDPEKNFPTIQDQMKLCKIIAHSLTSAANKKARGAKMFAKRQKRSMKWIHDGKLVTLNPLDDIPGYNPHYYDEEEDQRLHFKIPSLKNRVSSPETETKMSLTQEEFERLRLDSQRCEHQSVSPNQCFDIAQSLKNSKGKAGKLFEKRRQRVEKYVVDETNAQKSPVKPAKLGGMTKPLKGPLSPWDAALENPCGSVEKAFEDLTEFERKQKLNQMLKLKQSAPPAPAPAPRPVTPPLVLPPNLKHASLRADPSQLLQGKNFNRKARGWTGFNEPSVSYTPPISGSSSPVPSHPTPQQQQMARPPFRDYNNSPKAWRTSGEFEPQYPGHSSPYASDSSNIMSPSGYRNPGFGQPASDLPGTDL